MNEDWGGDEGAWVKSENVVCEKSYALAVRIVKMCQHLSEKKRERVLSKQALRSGTSIGANVEETIGAQSKADFISKMSVAYKEARETSYWLRLLKNTDYLTESEFDSIHTDVEEVCRIISSIQTTCQMNK